MIPFFPSRLLYSIHTETPALSFVSSRESRGYLPGEFVRVRSQQLDDLLSPIFLLPSYRPSCQPTYGIIIHFTTVLLSSYPPLPLMDNFSSAVPAGASVKVSLPDTTFGIPMSHRGGLYLALAAVVLLAWLLSPGATGTKIGVPLYEASRWKWVFDAETLICDSYRKVCWSISFRAATTRATHALVLNFLTRSSSPHF